MKVLKEIISTDGDVIGHTVNLSEKDLYLLNSMLCERQKTGTSIEMEHVEYMLHQVVFMLPAVGGGK